MKRDLVLLHGWGVNSTVWEPLLPYLAPDYSVHLIDLPGHGDGSDFVQKDLQAWSQQVAAQVPDHSLWLAWSLGGLIALNIAATISNKVSALVVLAGTAKFVQGVGWPCAMENTVFDRFATSLQQDVNDTMRRFLVTVASGSGNSGQVLKRLKAIYQKLPPSNTALEAGLELLRTTDLRAALKQLAIPLLFLLGEGDKLIPSGLNKVLVQQYACVESVLIENCGHALFLEKPELIAQNTIEFFQRRIAS